MFKYIIDILKEKKDKADRIIDQWLAKYKWPMARYTAVSGGFFSLGYYAHMTLTNNTGAALRGTLFSM